MKVQSVAVLTTGLLVRTISAQTALGSVTFGTPRCGTDLSHPVDGFNASDCTPAFNQLLDAHCSSGLCTILSTETSLSQTVRTCIADLFVSVTGTNGVTFNEAPVRNSIPGFVAQCTTEGDKARGFPELESTNGALLLTFLLSEGFE